MSVELKELMEKAVGIEAKIHELSEAKAADEKSRAELTAELKELGEKQTALARKVLSLQQEGAAKSGAEGAVKSLGAQFIESTPYKELMDGRITKASFTLADPTSVKTPDGAVPADFRGIKGTPMLPTTVTSAFPHVPTKSNGISYLKEKAFTNSAAEVAEGGLKPTSNIEFEEATANVKTIAHIIKVTKQLAEDAPALAAYINARMKYGLDLRIENQLLNGDGKGNNIEGIFLAGNYTPHGFTDKTMPADSTVLDLIRRCAAVIGKQGYKANKLFLNPMDFDTLRGMKDKSGQYLMGSPLQAGADIRPWGLSVVESAFVADGKFMVADTVMGATVYDRSQPVIEMFEQDENNVQHNLYTIRAEQRLAFSIDCVKCFVGGDLAIATTTETKAKA